MFNSLIHDDGLWFPNDHWLDPCRCFDKGNQGSCSWHQATLCWNVQVRIGPNKVSSFLNRQGRKSKLLIIHLPIQSNHHIIRCFFIHDIASFFNSIFEPRFSDHIDLFAQILVIHVVNGRKGSCIDSRNWGFYIEMSGQHIPNSLWCAGSVIGDKEIGNLTRLQFMDKSFSCRNS